ncbi:hypothetical protein CRE_03643 [Caenorhabditis remanei]|uniref:Uncharacterized protein n=2 Tax=Caenorhabditis remanei TaxID=31234 RepID=E3LXF2_CAERE|nr:hypothetical protein CRE_03643 [Caenorhabditis remanei]
MNIIAEPRRREDLDIYKDPHHEERITNWRLYPYYDQYGRPSGSQTDAHRPAYDSSGRRIRFDGPSSSSSSSSSDSGSGSGSGSSFGSSSSAQNIQNVPNNQNNQISHNYQYYDSQQQPPRNHPGYEEWLRNQYRIRGIIPRGYNEYFNAHSNQDAVYQNRYGSSSGNGNAQETNREFEQPAYILQPNSGNSENNENNQVFYEGGRNENQLNFGNADSENSRDDLGDSGSNSRNSETGETYYSVNPGDPVDASGTQPRVDGEFRQVKNPGEDERDAGDSKNVVIPKNQDAQQQHIRFIRYHPPTVIRDKKGNSYDRRVENGKVHYIDKSGNEVKTKIDDTAIDMKIERILENRRRQEENLRNLVENSESEDGSDPISAAEVARQG